MNSYLSGVSMGRERSRVTWDLHLPPADTHPRLSRTQSRGARLDAALTRRHRDQLELCSEPKTRALRGARGGGGARDTQRRLHTIGWG